MHWIYAHLIGDFILQNDWITEHKKNCSFRCAIHVFLYMTPFLFCKFEIWQLVAIAVQHFAFDRFDIAKRFLYLKGSVKFTNKPYFPWSVILIDNIFHILWIAFIAWIPTRIVFLY